LKVTGGTFDRAHVHREFSSECPLAFFPAALRGAFVVEGAAFGEVEAVFEANSARACQVEHAIEVGDGPRHFDVRPTACDVRGPDRKERHVEFRDATPH
jgi:hypothetical protein